MVPRDPKTTIQRDDDVRTHAGDDRATNSQKLVLTDSIDRCERRVEAIMSVFMSEKKDSEIFTNLVMDVRNGKLLKLRNKLDQNKFEPLMDCQNL